MDASSCVWQRDKARCPLVMTPATTTLLLLLVTTADSDCSSRDCDETLNREHLETLRRYMNLEADPCEDFHEFACSNWRREHANETTTMKLGDKRLTHRYLDLFEGWLREEREDEEKERLQRHLIRQDEIEVPPSEESSRRSRRLVESLDAVQSKVFEYYKVCRSLADGTTGRLSLTGYVEQLRETSNLWRPQPSSSPVDWLQTLADLASYGYSEHFVKLKVTTFNATDHRLTLLPHDVDMRLRLNRTGAVKESEANAIEEVFGVLGEYTTKDRGRIAEELRGFEDELNAVITRVESATSTKGSDSDVDDADDDDDEEEDELVFLELTLEQLTAEVGDGHLDWPMFLGRILERRVDAAETVLVERLATVRAIVGLLQRTDRETLFLYTLARFLQHLRDERAPNFLRTPATRYDCVRHMRQNLHLPMSYVYERAFYAQQRPRSDAIIRRIFDELRREFDRILQENAMGVAEPEVQYLRHKIARMRLNVGNLPSTNPADAFYGEYVRNLHVNGNFYHNHLHALRHFYGHWHFRASLRDHDLASPLHAFHLNPPDLDDFLDMSPFYHCLGNIIIIPYAYLQLPFYSHHFRDTLLYGDLANMLGHELMHGYESSFLAYDANGAKNRTAYRAIVSNRQFRENLACLDVGTQHLSERIADVSGTHLTIRTFLRDPDRRARTGRLFFLQFAQFFCGSAEDPATFHEEDPIHDVDNVRLNYVLAQMPEFAEVFECPRGSAMHPEQRCHLW